ncbi:MAG: hypothetical protein HOP11_00010 [Saprospiraceae bacterium]|nr:hypothetical protein [Saprospiraceae bacterium]
MLKVMVLSILLLGGINLSDTADDGYDLVKARIAQHFSVSVSNVSLHSPNTVIVTLPSSTATGTLSLADCGALCTEVTANFPNDIFVFIVEDDIQLL